MTTPADARMSRPVDKRVAGCRTLRINRRTTLARRPRPGRPAPAIGLDPNAGGKTVAFLYYPSAATRARLRARPSYRPKPYFEHVAVNDGFGLALSWLS